MRRFHFLSLLYDLVLILLMALLMVWVWQHWQSRPLPSSIPPHTSSPSIEPAPEWDWSDFFASRPPPRLRPVPPQHVAGVVGSVYEQSTVTRSYDPSYVKLAYPGGDVNPETGVCTDVVIRAFRAQGVDLQQMVHEDMRKAFRQYPRKWGMKAPDPNIDHRRVPNLMTFFARKGKSLAISDDPNDYIAGDVVVWELESGQHHIGVVMKERSYDEQRPLIGHNINAGAQVEDVLFAWPVVGHYRYFEPLLAQSQSAKP